MFAASFDYNTNASGKVVYMGHEILRAILFPMPFSQKPIFFQKSIKVYIRFDILFVHNALSEKEQNEFHFATGAKTKRMKLSERFAA